MTTPGEGRVAGLLAVWCRTRTLVSAFTVTLLALSSSALALDPGPSRAELVAIFEATRALQTPDDLDGIPDYTPAATERAKHQLAELREQFNQLDPTDWSQRDQVDYLLTRSELDKLSYGFYVYRPTSRNPNFYLSAFTSFGLASGPTLHRLNTLVREPPPFDAERTDRIIRHLQTIPAILDQARSNLTEPTLEMTRLALSTLAEPEDNMLAFAEALAPKLPTAQRDDFIAATSIAGQALESYRTWLEESLPTLPSATPIGSEMYDWILQRIWLVPFTGDELLQLAEQEYGRYLTFTELEQARNKTLPPAEPVATTADYIRLTESDEQRIREFLEEKDVLTIPDYVGPYRRALMPDYMTAIPLWAGLSGYPLPNNGVAKYAVPEDHPYTQSYWEAVMRMDPSTNILHDGIPGHHFQGLVSRRHPSEIRSQRSERFKSEGWCTYWEEVGIQLGYFDDRPRSRELVYNFLRLRALRVIIDILMARGEMTVEEGTAALMTIPMDRRIAVEEAYDFFVAPTGGIVYQVGKMQIERLLGEQRNVLGEAFSLREFHDTVVSAAWVPLELTRWEMLGRGEHAQRWLMDRSRPPWE